MEKESHYLRHHELRIDATFLPHSTQTNKFRVFSCWYKPMLESTVQKRQQKPVQRRAGGRDRLGASLSCHDRLSCHWPAFRLSPRHPCSHAIMYDVAHAFHSAREIDTAKSVSFGKKN